MSSLGLDNTGYNKFETDIEPSQPNIYNCATSKMWVKLNNWWQDELFNTFKRIREGKYTYENIIHYLVETQIDIIPQIAYNKDMYAKYISQGRQYLHMLHGNNKDHLLRWLYNRFQYVDSLFLQQNSPYTKESITIRSNKPLWVPDDERYTARFEIETYCPQYVTICWRKNTYETKRIGFNETVVFENEMVNDTDNEIIVYCAGNLKRIGDCTNLRPTSIDIGFATRLVEFKCEDSDVLLKADLSKNSYLKEVSFKGCSEMGNTTGGANVLDVSQCTNLRKIDVRGTQITAIQSNTDGGNLEEILYSDMTQSIVLSKQTNLRLIGIPYGYENIWAGLDDVHIDSGYSAIYDPDTGSFTKSSDMAFYTILKRKTDTVNEITTDNLWEVNEKHTFDVILPVNGTTLYMYFFDSNKNYVGTKDVVDSTTHTEQTIVNIVPPTGSCYCLITVKFEKDMKKNLEGFGVVKEGNTDFKTLESLTNVQINNCENVEALDIYSGIVPNDNLFKSMKYTQNLTLDNSLGISSLNFEGFNKLRNLTIRNMFDMTSVGFDDMINNVDTATLYNVTLINCPLIKDLTMNVSSDEYSIRFADNATLDISGLTSVETIESNYFVKGLNKIILPLQVKNIIFSGEYGDGTSDIMNIWSTDAIGDHLNDDYNGIDFKNIELDEINLLGITGISNGLNLNVSPTNVIPHFNTGRTGSVTKPWFRPEGSIDITNYGRDMIGLFKGIDTTKFNISLSNPVMVQKDLSELFSNAIVNDITVVNKILSNCPNVDNLDMVLMNATPIDSIQDIYLPSNDFSLNRGFMGCTGLLADIELPSNVIDVTEAFRDCTSIKDIHDNWNNDYNNEIEYENCYMNCSAIEKIAEEEGTLNEVPRSWGGYGFDSEVTMVAEISTYAAGTKTIRICDTESDTVHTYTDWGDGTIDDKFYHTYTREGIYNIKTQRLSTEGYAFATSFKNSLISISQMPTQLTEYVDLFKNCVNLVSADFTINDNTSSISGLFNGCKLLESVNINLPKSCNNLSYLFKNCNVLESVEFMTDWDMSQIINMREIFNGCYKLVSIDVSNWDVSNVTTLYSAFQYCYEITELDVSNWDVSKVTTLYRVFYNCNVLENIDVSKWNTSNVENFNGVFQYCYKLTSIDVSNWDVSKATTFQFMFQTTLIDSLDLSNWKPTKVTSLMSMFQNCSKLTNVIFGNWDLPSCTNLSYMFNGCSSLISADLSGLVFAKINNMDSMFSSCSKITSIILPDLSSGTLTRMTGVFQGCTQLTSITNLEKINTAKVTTFDCLFQSCSSITQLNVSDWNTELVTNLNSTFDDCESLTELDLSNWDVSRVTIMTSVFKNCFNLVTLNISGWSTDNLQSMSGAFAECYALKVIDVENWNISKVASLEEVFSRCESIETLDLSKWDVSKVTIIKNLFNKCLSLKSLNVSTWNTTAMNDLQYAFNGCSSLETLDLSSWDLTKANLSNSLYFIFKATDKLTEIISPKNINSALEISTKQASREILVVIINNLMDRTSYSSLNLSLSQSNIDLLTSDDILIATNKNWSVVVAK